MHLKMIVLVREPKAAVIHIILQLKLAKETKQKTVTFHKLKKAINR